MSHISVCYLWNDRCGKGCENKNKEVQLPEIPKQRKIGVAEEPVRKRKRRSKKNQPLPGQLSFIKEEV